MFSLHLMLIALFILLGLPEFHPTAHFGILCAVRLLAGQVFELLLMPALLGMRLRKSQKALTAQ